VIRSARILAAALALGAALGPAAPARADLAVGASAFFPSSAGATFGALASLGTHFAFLPVRTQLTGAALLGGRYALTGEVQLGLPAESYVGAGVGFGRMRQFGGKTGSMFDVLAGKHLTRNASLEARYYNGGSGAVGTSESVGLKYGL